MAEALLTSPIYFPYFLLGQFFGHGASVYQREITSALSLLPVIVALEGNGHEAYFPKRIPMFMLVNLL